MSVKYGPQKRRWITIPPQIKIKAELSDLLEVFGFKYSTGGMWVHNTFGYISISEETGVEDLAMIIFQRGREAKAAELRKVLGIID